MNSCEICGGDIPVKFKGYLNLPYCYNCWVKQHSKGIGIEDKIKRLKEKGVI